MGPPPRTQHSRTVGAHSGQRPTSQTYAHTSPTLLAIFRRLSVLIVIRRLCVITFRLRKVFREATSLAETLASALRSRKDQVSLAAKLCRFLAAWPGHSFGPETYPAMAAVAERLVGRCAAPAQRHPSVLPDQRVVLTEDRDVAADEQRAVRAFLYRGRLRHRLLRPAVKAAEVQRARG